MSNQTYQHVILLCTLLTQAYYKDVFIYKVIDTLVGMFYETFSFCVRVDFVAMHFAPATATL